MHRYAIIENNTVTNVAVADSPMLSNWVASGAAAIGDTYVDGQFIKPAAPEPEPAPAPTKEQLMAQLAALSAQIQALE